MTPGRAGLTRPQLLPEPCAMVGPFQYLSPRRLEPAARGRRITASHALPSLVLLMGDEMGVGDGRQHDRQQQYCARFPALSVLVVAEWLDLDRASRAPKPLPDNFVHAEWITRVTFLSCADTLV
jgi:hypothetical protein